MKSEFDFDALLQEVLAVPAARTAYVENGLRQRLAEAFNEARMRKGLSVRELAAEMNTSISQVQRLLQHEVGGSLTLRTVCRAADALGLSISFHVREKQLHGGCVIPFGRVATAWQSIPGEVAAEVEVPRNLPVSISVAAGHRTHQVTWYKDTSGARGKLASA